MIDEIKLKQVISGSGTLVVDEDGITILCSNSGEYKLADIVSHMSGKSVQFRFAVEEDID